MNLKTDGVLWKTAGSNVNYLEFIVNELKHTKHLYGQLASAQIECVLSEALQASVLHYHCRPPLKGPKREWRNSSSSSSSRPVKSGTWIMASM